MVVSKGSKKVGTKKKSGSLSSDSRSTSSSSSRSGSSSCSSSTVSSSSVSRSTSSSSSSRRSRRARRPTRSRSPRRSRGSPVRDRYAGPRRSRSPYRRLSPIRNNRWRAYPSPIRNRRLADMSPDRNRKPRGRSPRRDVSPKKSPPKRSPRRGASPRKSHSPKKIGRKRSRSASREVKSAPTKVCVRKLSRNVNKEHLLEIFGNYGLLKKCSISSDRVHPHLSCGVAYLDFEKSEGAEKALAHMDGGQIDGMRIECEAVKSVSPSHGVGRERNARVRR